MTARELVLRYEIPAAAALTEWKLSEVRRPDESELAGRVHVEVVGAATFGAAFRGAIFCRRRIRPGEEVVHQTRCTIGAMTPYKGDAWEKQNLILQGTWAWHLDGIPDVAGATEKTPECFFGDGKKRRHGPFHFPLFGGHFHPTEKL